MSWDIIAQDFPDVQSVDDIADDFEPKPIGLRSEIIAKITKAFPSANFSDPSWGLIEFEDGSIEVNIGEQEECDSFMLHVRGGDSAFLAIASILNAVGVRAIDCQTSEFFDASASQSSFSNWQEYRDKVVTEYAEPPRQSIWSKFRNMFGGVS
jgi:hypothetical protein